MYCLLFMCLDVWIKNKVELNVLYWLSFSKRNKETFVRKKKSNFGNFGVTVEQHESVLRHG